MLKGMTLPCAEDKTGQGAITGQYQSHLQVWVLFLVPPSPKMLWSWICKSPDKAQPHQRQKPCCPVPVFMSEDEIFSRLTLWIKTKSHITTAWKEMVSPMKLKKKWNPIEEGSLGQAPGNPLTRSVARLGKCPQRKWETCKPKAQPPWKDSTSCAHCLPDPVQALHPGARTARQQKKVIK